MGFFFLGGGREGAGRVVIDKITTIFSCVFWWEVLYIMFNKYHIII